MTQRCRALNLEPAALSGSQKQVPALPGVFDLARGEHGNND
jgi:hypothetical protein